MCMCLTKAISQDAHADMYMTNVSVAPGTQAEISINIENTKDGVAGFSCKVYLPEGFTVEKASRGSRLMKKNTSGEYNTTFMSQLQADGSYMLLAYGGVPFEGTDGEVAVLTINIPEVAAFGDYEISMKEIETSVGAYTMQTYTEFVSTLTVGEPTYEEGYTLQTVPFIMNEDGDYEMSVTMDNTDAVKSIEFDLVLPEGLYIDGEDGEYFVDLGSRVTSSTVSNQFFSSVEENADGSFHVLANFKRSTSSYVFTGNSGEALVFPMFADGLTNGLYKVEFKNIVLNGNLAVAPYKASFIVGSPAFEGNVTLYGNYAESVDVLEYVANKNGVTSVDLCEVIDIDNGTSVITANSNALLYLPADKTIANSSNVVIGDECANLVITDGYPFSSPKPFSAANASYSRSMTTDWGTICLPYAIESDDDIQLYQFKEMTGETLVFSEVASLEAGKPGVFKRLDASSSITMSASDAPIVVGVGEGDVTQNLKMIGTFEDITVTVDPSAPSYYIKDNTFLKGNGNFKIPAYRAYFQSEVAMSAKALNIAVEDEATGIRTVVGKLDAEKGEIYSINGMKISKPSRNSLYIQNGKKFFAK